jgi:hypothetical protein
MYIFLSADNQQTEIEQISFTKDHIPAKVLCDKVLEAVDADGDRHTFRPEAHVSSIYSS